MTRSDWLSAAAIAAGCTLIVAHVGLTYGWIDSLWVAGAFWVAGGVAGGLRS